MCFYVLDIIYISYFSVFGWIQIIICNDGAWGLCYEHSTSEGIAVVLLLEEIVKKIDERQTTEEPSSQQHLPPPERLDWQTTPELEGRLKAAARSVDERIEDLDFYVYRYQNYGKTFIKSCQVSPDVYIQLALQLAYYKYYKIFKMFKQFIQTIHISV